MDEKINNAFDTANYMATISNQRRLILEEYKQSVIYYKNGGTFVVTPELINFAKTLVDMGHTENVPFLDTNQLPVMIEDVTELLEELMSTYFEAVNSYHQKYSEMRSKRRISQVMGL